MSTAGVRLEGGGLGLACAAHLLRRAGIAAYGRFAPPYAMAPALLLSDKALGLIADVFGADTELASLPRITRRAVLWGKGEATILPHDAVAATQADLHAAIPPICDSIDPPEAPNFTLHAGPPPSEAGSLLQFGHRPASACRVMLSEKTDRAAVFIEAVSAGWLFLIPSGEGQGWLLGVGGAVEDLVSESRLIAAQVQGLGSATAHFETAPRMLPRLTGESWLTLGSSALAFDPICGDGSAQSLRGAILAAAVVEAAVAPHADQPALFAHYQAMLIAAMRRHLQISAQFYASGGDGPWWGAQLAATAQGYDWCTRQLATCSEPRFTLRGFALHARELAV